ncbi:unnamed protein product [Polarella glacialis]|uniref:Thioredoxin domain-containing protein n=1 Tax=Polarella glacialis TaxID=89957 RepID=A0A813FLH6_POLGL|nr:unnamed protein product [Polarella glacialis]
MSLNRALVLFSLLVAANAWPFSSTSVVTLTSSSFDSRIRANGKTMVEFYAPWCGHCKKLEPAYEEAAAALLGHGVVLAKIDGSLAKDVAARFGIENYPSLLWFEGGRKSDYDGEQPPTAAALIEWVGNAIRPPVIETASPAAPGKLPRMVLHAPELYEGFSDAAKVNRTSAVWYFVKDTTGNPKVVLQHKGEEPIEMTSYVADQDVIMAFLSDHAAPLLGKLDGETFSLYSGKPLIWSLFPGDIAAVEAEYRPMLMEVAEKLAGKYCVTFTDTVKFKDNIDGMLGVDQFPAIVVQPKAGAKTKFVYTGDMTASAIVRFVEEVDAGKVARSFKSELEPTSNDRPVRVVVSNTFHKEVFVETKDVFIEIYAPWCGSCKKLQPEYLKLAKYVQQWELGEVITIAKIDGTANDIPVATMDYSSFPTLYFVRAGSDTPLKYQGERTSKGMWAWIKDHTSRLEAVKKRLTAVKSRQKRKDL